jgi:homoserine trans-succinylase
MSGFFRKLPRLLTGSVLVFLLLFLNSNTALAQAQTSGTIVVTAVIAPVRYVLIDNKGNIKEILSNTKENITPKVYINSLSSSQATLTIQVYQRYEAIIDKVNTKRTGIIYQNKNKNSIRTAQRLINFIRDESVLLVK